MGILTFETTLRLFKRKMIVNAELYLNYCMLSQFESRSKCNEQKYFLLEWPSENLIRYLLQKLSTQEQNGEKGSTRKNKSRTIFVKSQFSSDSYDDFLITRFRTARGDHVLCKSQHNICNFFFA